MALYGYTYIKAQNKNILVFDLGGTSLDITINKFEENVFLVENSYEINDINTGEKTLIKAFMSIY